MLFHYLGTLQKTKKKQLLFSKGKPERKETKKETLNQVNIYKTRILVATTRVIKDAIFISIKDFKNLQMEG